MHRTGRLIDFLRNSIIFGSFITNINRGIIVIRIFFKVLRGLIFLFEFGVVVSEGILGRGLGNLLGWWLVEFVAELIEVIHNGEFLDLVILLETLCLVVIVINVDTVLLCLVLHELFWRLLHLNLIKYLERLIQI